MAKQTITLEVVHKGTKGAAAGLQSIMSVAGHLTTVLTGLTKVMRVMGRVISSGIKDALLLEKSIQQLRATYSAMGSNVDTSIKSILGFANAMENATTKSADQILEMSNLALQYSRSEKHTQDMVRATVALEAAVGLKANMALRGLSQTLQGQTGVLSRYVPQISKMTEEQLKSGEAIRMIAEQYMPALEGTMRTVHGQYERLSNLIASRYVEELGNAIINNKAFVAGMKELGNILVENAPKFDNLRNSVVDITKSMVDFVANVVGASVAIGNALGSIVKAGGMVVKGFARMQMAFAWMARDKRTLEYFREVEQKADAFTTSLDQAQKNAEDWSVKFGEAAYRVKRAMDSVSGSLDAPVKKTKQMAKAAKQAADDYRSLNAALGDEMTTGMDEGLGKWAERRKQLDESLERIKSKITERYEWEQRQITETAAYEDRQIAQRQAKYKKTFTYIAEVGTQAFMDLASGQKTFGEVALDVLQQVAMMIFKSSITAVINNAVVAATGAAKSQAGIPVIGPILAAVAAGAVLAATLAMKNKLKPPAMAFGGLVTGGAVHTDSVPITAMPGERMLNRRETREYEDWKAGRQQRGGQVIINAQIPPNIANKLETQRWTRDTLLPAIEDLARHGHLRFMGVG
jgi:hypothetical protein